MNELLNGLIASASREPAKARTYTVKRRQRLRDAVLALVDEHNSNHPAARRVTRRQALTAADRSLNDTASRPLDQRHFTASRRVIRLLETAAGRSTMIDPRDLDLLPSGHPLHPSALTASPRLRAEWLATDPRMPAAARQHAVAALSATSSPAAREFHRQALIASAAPRDLVLAITAALFLDGNSSAARSARARLQWRDRYGKWIEMGGAMFGLMNVSGAFYRVFGKVVGTHMTTDYVDVVEIEVNNDPNLPDGIYSFPISGSEMVQAILPESDVAKLPNGGKDVPSADEALAVDFEKVLASKQDLPTGWKHLTLPTSSKTYMSPDDAYTSDDGYVLSKFNSTTSPGAKTALKAAQAGGIPVLGSDAEGNLNADEPVYVLKRSTQGGTAPKTVGIAQSWGDVQKLASEDQDDFVAELEKAQGAKAELKKSLQPPTPEADSEGAKYVNDQLKEAYKDQISEADAKKATAQKAVDDNTDLLGNPLPEGWTPRLTPSGDNVEFVTEVDGVEIVTTQDPETGRVTVDEAGKSYTWEGLKRKLYNIALGKRQAMKDRANAALDALLGKSDTPRVDTDGRDQGKKTLADIDAVLNSDAWKEAKQDYDTRMDVDLPTAAQTEKWKKFEEAQKALNELRATESRRQQQLTDALDKAAPPPPPPAVWEGYYRDPIQKIDSLDGLDIAPEDEPIAELLEEIGDILEDVNTPEPEPGDMEKLNELNKRLDGFLKESAETSAVKRLAQDVQADIADVTAPTQAELPPNEEEEPPAEQADPTEAFTVPEGGYALKLADWEPDDFQAEDVADYTEDPAELAKKFSQEELEAALAQAVIGVKDFASDFLDSLPEDEESEDDGPKKKGKPGPKKKKPAKPKIASGSGMLEFDDGPAWVPAEALYNALKEDGVDADLAVARMYDSQLDEPVNEEYLNSLGDEVDTEFDDAMYEMLDEETVKAVNAETATSSAASVAVSTMRVAEPTPQTQEIAAALSALDPATSEDDDSGVHNVLSTFIGWAYSDDEAEQSAFHGLWGLLMSIDGGGTGLETTPENGSLKSAVYKSFLEYTGDPDQALASTEELFRTYGYYDSFVMSRKNFADGIEQADNPFSVAGQFYSLMSALGSDNATKLYRGVRLDASSQLFEDYTTPGQLVNIDPRSWTTDQMTALNFSGVFSGTDERRIVFTIQPGTAESFNTEGISWFPGEIEHMAWGNFVVDSAVEKDIDGVPVYQVQLRPATDNELVLGGQNDDYVDLLLPENNVPELPDGYYIPFTEVYDEDSDDESLPEGVTFSPLFIARSWAPDDLAEQFRAGIEDGSGTGSLDYGDAVYQVPVESLRDALQIHGINTDTLLQDIADAGPAASAEDADLEPAEMETDTPFGEALASHSYMHDASGMEKVGPQGGSNPGGTYVHPNTKQPFYVKTPKSQIHGENEVLASALYEALGIPAARQYKGKNEDGDFVTMSPIVPGDGTTLADHLDDQDYLDQLKDGFAVDAWLANWDVAGLVFDNVITDDSGNPLRVDPGGALLFRAQGAPKHSAFGPEVGELQSLKTSSQGGKVFGDITPEQEAESARKLLDISDEQIDQITSAIITDPDTAQQLATTLKQRRQYILDYYGITGEDTSLLVEQNKLDEPEPEPEPTTTAGLDNIALAQDWLREFQDDPETYNFDETDAEFFGQVEQGLLDAKQDYEAGTSDDEAYRLALLDVSASLFKYMGDINGDDLTAYNNIASVKEIVDNEIARVEQLQATPAADVDADPAEAPAGLTDSGDSLKNVIDWLNEYYANPAAYGIRIQDIDQLSEIASDLAAIKQRHDRGILNDKEYQSELYDYGYGLQDIIDGYDPDNDSTGYNNLESILDELKIEFVKYEDTELPDDTTPAVDTPAPDAPAVEEAPAPAEVVSDFPKASDGTQLEAGLDVSHKKQGKDGVVVKNDLKHPGYVWVMFDGETKAKIVSANQLTSGDGASTPAATPSVPEAPSATGGYPVASDGTQLTEGALMIHKKSGKHSKVIKNDLNHPGYVWVVHDDAPTKKKLVSANQLIADTGGGGFDPGNGGGGSPEPDPTPATDPFETAPTPEASEIFGVAPDGYVTNEGFKLSKDNLRMAFIDSENGYTGGLSDADILKELEYAGIDNLIDAYNEDDPGFLLAPAGKYEFQVGTEDALRFYSYMKAKKMPAKAQTEPQPVSAPTPEAPSATEVTVQDTGTLANGVTYSLQQTTTKVPTYPGKTGTGAAVKITLGGNTYANKTDIKAAGFKWDPTDKKWYKVVHVPMGLDYKKEAKKALEQISPIQQEEPLAEWEKELLGLPPYGNGTPESSPAAPASTEPLTPPPGTHSLSNKAGVQFFKGLKVTDKTGRTGVITSVKTDIPYANVRFDDGGVGLRSINTLTSLNELDNAAANAPTLSKSGNTPTGAPPVIVEGQPDWTSSGLDTVPSMTDALAALDSDEPFAATRGASFAVDSGDVEDFDVRVMKVYDESTGGEAYHLKYKLTSWAANDLIKGIINGKLNGWTSTNGAKLTSMTLDPDTGVATLNTVSPPGMKTNDGMTYTRVLPGGIRIKITRGNKTANNSMGSSGARALHNLVEITAPVGVTENDIANALAEAGVRDVRPATPADVKILAENRLMSIFGMETNPNTNLSGAARQDMLDKIAAKWGVTADDVTLVTGANGRLELRVPEAVAEKIAKATGVKSIFRQSYGNNTYTPDQSAIRAAGIIAGPHGGLISTSVRWTEGVGQTGLTGNIWMDLQSGGAEYVFMHPRSFFPSGDQNGIKYVFDPKKLFQRLDFYANASDKYGKRAQKADIIKEAQAGNYEVMFKHRVDWEAISYILVPQNQRDMIIAEVKRLGMSEIGGRPVEQVIVSQKPDWAV